MSKEAKHTDLPWIFNRANNQIGHMKADGVFIPVAALFLPDDQANGELIIRAMTEYLAGGGT